MSRPQTLQRNSLFCLNWLELDFYLQPKSSLVAQMVKNLPAVLETWVQLLDWKDTVEKGMATYSNILA